jgi:hypothetical protein
MEDMMGKKKFRDRRDAKRIKMPAMMRLLTYLTDRQDADVYINRKEGIGIFKSKISIQKIK